MNYITTLIATATIQTSLFGVSSFDQSCCPSTCSQQCIILCTTFGFAPDEVEPSQRTVQRDLNRARPDRRPPKEGQEGRAPWIEQRQLPENMTEHIMAVAEEIDPDLANQLKHMCEEDPEGFEKIIRRQGRRLGSLVRLRDADPELFVIKVNELKTDAEIGKVTQTIRKAGVKDPMFLAHVMELRALVRAKAALSLRAKSLYIERMEKHLIAMRQDLEDTSSNFDQIVEDRIDKLIKVVYEEDSQIPTKEE